MKKIIITLVFLFIASYAMADAPVSWRGYMSTPHVQTGDGYCTAYAALHCVEGLYNYCYELNNFLEISEDQYLFQGEPLWFMGDVFDDIKEQRVISINENAYPNLSHSYFSIAGHDDIPSTATNGYSNNNRLENLLEHLANWGPVGLQIYGYSNIKFYVENLYDPESVSPQNRVPATLTTGGTGGDFHCVTVVDSGFYNDQLYLECFNSYHTEDDHFFKIFTDTQNFEVWAGEVVAARLHERDSPYYEFDRISETDPNIEFFFAPKIYPYLNKRLVSYDPDPPHIETYGCLLEFFAEDEEVYILENIELECDIYGDDEYPMPDPVWPNTIIINVSREYTDGYAHNIVVFDDTNDLELSDCIIRPFGTGDCDGVLRVSNGSLSLDDVLINDLDYGISIIGNSTVDAEYITIANADYGVYLAAGSSITIQDSHIGTPNDGGNDISFNRLIQGGYGAGFTLSNSNITWNESYYAMINDYESVDVSTNFWDTNVEGDIYDVFSCYGLVEYWGSRAHVKIDNIGSSSTPKIAAPNPYEMARYYDSIGDWDNAKNSYLQAISQSDDSMLNKRSIQYLLRIYKDQEWPADDLRIIARNEYDKALNKHKPTFDYLYNATYLAEGDYYTAIEMFEKCAEKYAGTSVEVRMLSRIANIYGDYLDDPATAKEYADRAAAINPGQPILFSAYWSAGIRYEPEDYTDKFYRVLEYYDITDDPESEPVAGDQITATPNPFNPSTTIRYTLNQPSRVDLSIYTLAGQKIEALIDTHQQAGNHAVTFDGGHLATGIYFYRFKTADVVKTGKLLLMK